MLGLCLRVAGVDWEVILPEVPLGDVQDLAPWGSRNDDVGCCEYLIHNQ